MDDKRLIDANELKRRLIEGDGHDDDGFTEGYNFAINEIRGYIADAPTIEAQPVKQSTELSIILQDYGIKDTDTLRYILDQYQKIIVDITGGQMSDMTYPAQAVIECTNDYYLSALADFKEKLVKHGQWILHTKRIVDVDIKLPTECSECGFEEFSAEKYNFCPECGAKMDLKEI